MVVMMLRRFIALGVSLAIAYFGYHYLNKKGVPVPAPVSPTSQIQGAAQAVQQDQNYSNQVKSTVQNQLNQ